MVTDAGAWVRVLFLEGPTGTTRRRLSREAEVDAPALIDLEFLSGVRGLVSRGLVGPADAETGLSQFLESPIRRHLHAPLVWRVWELRGSVTPHDAAYVALAEALGTTLLTTDERLTRATGLCCDIEVAV